MISGITVKISNSLRIIRFGGWIYIFLLLNLFSTRTKLIPLSERMHFQTKEGISPSNETLSAMQLSHQITGNGISDPSSNPRRRC